MSEAFFKLYHVISFELKRGKSKDDPYIMLNIIITTKSLLRLEGN